MNGSIAYPQDKAEPSDTHYLRLAREHMATYEAIMSDDIVVRDEIEAHEQMRVAQAYAALAAAEAATRQAAVMESLLEFAAEFVGGTNLTAALLAWGERKGT